MTTNHGRIFGGRLDFRSLSCAPVNELGVVYLFGVLHETFDLKVESIQSGFPDCIARRPVGRDRWQEVRIEFEYESRSFVTHGHDPDAVDMLVCWRHNWTDCPQRIEVVELSTQLGAAAAIQKQTDTRETLTTWQQYCRQKRREGVASFAEIARLWRTEKGRRGPEKKRRPRSVPAEPRQGLTTWQAFCRQKMLEGAADLAEVGRLWRAEKAKQAPRGVSS